MTNLNVTAIVTDNFQSYSQCVISDNWQLICIAETCAIVTIVYF